MTHNHASLMTGPADSGWFHQKSCRSGQPPVQGQIGHDVLIVVVPFVVMPFVVMPFMVMVMVMADSRNG